MPKQQPLSENPEMADVTTQREWEALEAYLKLLASKGADADNLQRRRAFLQRLIPHLAGQPLDGGLYRDSLDQVLQDIQKSEWPFYLNVGRDYYHFWINDIKSIAAMHASGAYEIAPTFADIPTEKLKTLWKTLDNEKFAVSELWPLKAYRAALREEGADQSVVETRAKLVKLLLLKLRDAPEKNGKHYRVAVDSTLPLFTMRETRYLFLTVVREFFYFWIGDPQAASHIVLETSQGGD